MCVKALLSQFFFKNLCNYQRYCKENLLLVSHNLGPSRIINRGKKTSKEIPAFPWETIKTLSNLEKCQVRLFYSKGSVFLF